MASNNHLYITTGYKIVYPEGDRSLQRVKLKFDPQPGDEYHVIIDGDTLTEISRQFYGDPQLWYIIADTNDIFNPFDDMLETGMYLRIPSIEQVDKFNTNTTNKTGF